MKNELIDMLCRKSFQYSSEPTFQLVSGLKSHFYVNCKPTTLSARGMFLAGHLMFAEIKELNVVGVGGLTFGADPIAVATAFASELKGSAVNAFSIRKTQKDHGIVRWIEGDVKPDQRVAIIDDVATTGGSRDRRRWTNFWEDNAGESTLTVQLGSSTPGNVPPPTTPVPSMTRARAPGRTWVPAGS